MSAPAAAAARPSAKLVTPQILTLTLMRRRQHSTERLKSQLRSAVAAECGCPGRSNAVGKGAWKNFRCFNKSACCARGRAHSGNFGFKALLERDRTVNRHRSW